MKFVKGLLLAASMLFANWQIEGDVSIASLLVAVAFLFGYYAKNWWFPSVSEDGIFDWKDVFSAVLIGISVAIPESISQIIVYDQIVWRELFSVVGVVVFTYVTATYVQDGEKFLLRNK